MTATMFAVPGAAPTSCVGDGPQSLPHPTPAVRGDAMLNTRPMLGIPEDADPYQPGDLVVRLADTRLLRVTAIHDLTVPTIDGWVPADRAPRGVRWLIDAEAPHILARPYLLAEIRPVHPATDLQSARRRQIARRLTRTGGTR